MAKNREFFMFIPAHGTIGFGFVGDDNSVI